MINCLAIVRSVISTVTRQRVARPVQVRGKRSKQYCSAVLKHQRQEQVLQAGRRAVLPCIHDAKRIVTWHSTCKEYLSFCCRSSCNAAPWRFTPALCSRAFWRRAGRWAVRLLSSALPQASGGPKMSPMAELSLPSMRLSLPAYTTTCLSRCRKHTTGCRLCTWTLACQL